LDEICLLPGQDWDLEIQRAIRRSQVVLVCLSASSLTKEGYVQREIKRALDLAEEKPEGTIFVIPVRLEAVTVPDRLRQWQWVNLFDPDGYDRLLSSLRLRGEALQVDSPEADHKVLASAGLGGQRPTVPTESVRLFGSEADLAAWVAGDPLVTACIGTDFDPYVFPRRSADILDVAIGSTDVKEVVAPRRENGGTLPARRAGQRADLVDQTLRSSALGVAILVSGSGTPGANSIIDAIVNRHWAYASANQGEGSLHIYGLKDGFQAFDRFQSAYYVLSPQPRGADRELATAHAARAGGSMLGTSRVPELALDSNIARFEQMIQMLGNELIEIIYIVGGDGSMRAAHALGLAARAANYPWRLRVVGIPATSNDDILCVSPSLGSSSVAAKAAEVLDNLACEIRSTKRICVVQMSGGYSGLAVCNAVVRTRPGTCDVALIPEIPFSAAALGRYVKEIVARDGHALVVIGESSIPVDFLDCASTAELSASEVKLLKLAHALRACDMRPTCAVDDVLRAAVLRIVSRTLALTVGMETNTRVFTSEPRHILRAGPPSPEELEIGRQIGTRAVDSALSGCSDVMLANFDTAYMLIPLVLSAQGARCVDRTGGLWRFVQQKTGQPAPLL
jgi:6-phosphofructokinase